MAYDTHLCIGLDGRTECSALPFDAVCLGQGVFETILFLNGCAILWERHISRLAQSCEALSIASARDATRLAGYCNGAVAETHRQAARVRIAVFGATGAPPGAIVSVGEYVRTAGPLRLSVAGGRRQVGDALARHKTVNYLANIRAREAAKAAGCDDALIVDSEGNIAETTTATVFLVGNARLVTPKTTSALPGVVRAWVFEAASEMGLGCVEEDIPEAALGSFQAAFVTNSIIGLAPVSAAGGAAYETGACEAFVRLSHAYSNLLASTGGG